MTTKNLLKFDSEDGSFKRQVSSFRHSISSDSQAQFPAEKGRYHVYISHGCPWAHRVLIYLTLKGLIKDYDPATSTVSDESIIGLSVVSWKFDDDGWRFPVAGEHECEGATSEPLYGCKRLSELYYKAEKDFSGRYTVPVVWDKKTETIVNNESSEIIRFLNTEFNGFIEDESKRSLDFYPSELKYEIDEINEWVYHNINNGVYKTGFSTKQEIYDKEVVRVFEHLDRVEELLKVKRSKGMKYLVSNQLTEADIRLFTTIIRFDPVYVSHFKCNLKMIRIDYPFIHDWLRDIYWNHEDIRKTVNFEHIKGLYYKSMTTLNPQRIQPVGPVPNVKPL